MKRKLRLHVWIFVLPVIALFVLSVMAPREWSSVAIAPIAHPSHLEQPTSIHRALERHALPMASDIEPLSPLAADPSPSFASLRYTRTPERVLPAAIDEPCLETRLRPMTDERRESAEENEPLSENDNPPIQLPARAASSPPADYSAPTCVVEIRARASKRHLPQHSSVKIAPTPLDSGSADVTPVAGTSFRLASGRFLPTESLAELDMSRQLSESLPEVSKHWPYAADLVYRLESLADRDICEPWCREVVERLRILSTLELLDSDEVVTVLESLAQLQKQGSRTALTVSEPRHRSELARAAFALGRRLEVWGQIRVIASASDQPVSSSVTDAEYFRRVISDLEAKLAEYDHGERWHEYLLLDEAKRRYGDHTPSDTAECRRLAKRILLRLDYSILRPEHHKFLSEPEIAEYMDALRRLANEPVDYFRLMDELERYEKKGIASHALHLAAAQCILRWSRDERIAELGRRLDSNYRNANIRIAVDDEMIRRLTPDQDPVAERVDGVILGARTWGRSESQAQVAVKLLPSPNAWKIGLRAKGQVVTETCSTKGPATFRSLGDAVFLAEKQIVIHPHGFHHESADAAAETSSRLAGLETDLDPVPIVGDIAQAIAERRYQSQAPAVRWQMDNMVASQARKRLDAEVGKQLSRAREQFLGHFYKPMEELALNPMALEMRTTDRCLVARYRLAGHHQLAAHTPRPVPPADSALNIQVHESAMNNVVEQFRWEGREANLRELYVEIGDLFDLRELEIPEEFPDDVTIRFAEEQPVRFTFADSRVALQLSFAELKQGRRRWRNFAVRVYYQPAPDQPDADLVREQYVELIGRRIRFGDQIALRGIFSRVFAKNQPVNLVSQRLKDDPRLQGLAINQLTIGDGWLGMSVAPKRQERHAQLPGSDRR
jgi:hypothetical protein